MLAHLRLIVKQFYYRYANVLNVNFKRKIVVTSFAAAWLVGIYFWLMMYEPRQLETDSPSVYDNSDSANFEFERLTLKNNDLVKYYLKTKGTSEENLIETHSAIYDYIAKNNDLNTLLVDLDFGQRCDLYFDNLLTKDVNWNIDPNHRFPLEHRYAYTYSSFRGETIDEAKKSYASQNNIDVSKVRDDDVEQTIKDSYNNFWAQTMNNEHEMAEILANLRIFNKCYITSDRIENVKEMNNFVSRQSSWIKDLVKTKLLRINKNKPQKQLLNRHTVESCATLESRMYKWLSFSYPVYERWNGEILFKPPVMSKYISYKGAFEASNAEAPSRDSGTKKLNSHVLGGSTKSCFLNNFKNQLNAKGIVLSISDGHVEDTVRLIRLLRALNNRYPIQIVYDSTISSESKKKIKDAARERFSDLPSSFEKVRAKFPQGYIDADEKSLPKQEVWFVSVYNTIQDSYKSKFDKFGNKLLAALFNSFEEYLLIDADTVFLKSPDFFFNMESYKKDGAFFFKDRTATQFRPDADAKFFKKMAPSILDEIFFDIPMITQHTTSLPFFDGMEHMMESGLVAINRNMHFNSILMLMQLNFFEPARGRVYGDKELFWLAFSLNGDEKYHFNSLAAATIGVETPAEERLTKLGEARRSREICSPHPGHIDGEDGKTLLWINSGFQYCGQSFRVDFDEEAKKGSRLKSIHTASDMKTFYESKLVIKQAIIPPFEDKWHTLCDNTEEEPKEGWVMDTQYCRSYLWCGYSSIGGLQNDGSDNTQKGLFIQFDQDQIDMISYLGDIWMGNE